MCHRAINNGFIKFVLKNVFLNRETVLEIFDRQLAHVHNCTNVELINPVGHLIDS